MSEAGGVCHNAEVKRMTIGWQNLYDLLFNQFLLLCNVASAITGQAKNDEGLWVADGGRGSFGIVKVTLRSSCLLILSSYHYC